MSRCTYVFLDESGNLDFGAGGSRYFVLTGVSLRRPSLAFQSLDDFKHHCLESWPEIEYFHAYRDGKRVRSRVFDLIAGHLNEMRIDCLIVEKAKTEPALREDRRFYSEMLGRLLKLIVPHELGVGGAEQVIAITDSIPVNRKRQAVEKAIRTTLTRTLPPGMKYRVLHHQSRSHYGLQVADYCCWAVFRKWQTGNLAWYNLIRPAVQNELEVHASTRSPRDDGQFSR